MSKTDHVGQKHATSRKPVIAYLDLTRSHFFSTGALFSLETSGENLNVAVEHQQQIEWCWAAVATSISRFYDRASAWTQCRVVNTILRETTCCENGRTKECDKQWYLESGLGTTNNLRDWFEGILSFENVRAEITARHPLGVRIGWYGGGGHFVIIDGYHEADGEFLSIKDPSRGLFTYQYDDFVNNYQGGGGWTHTYQTES